MLFAINFVSPCLSLSFLLSLIHDPNASKSLHHCLLIPYNILYYRAYLSISVIAAGSGNETQPPPSPAQQQQHSSSHGDERNP